MERRDFALAALAGSPGQSFTPVQLQKLLFLLDRNIGNRLGGSGFHFEPYHYGPFDKSVYRTIDQLALEGLAIVADLDSPRRTYSLTQNGQTIGENLLAQMDPGLRDYVAEVGKFVCSLTFAALVSSIYNAYPEMKVNSVFTS